MAVLYITEFASQGIDVNAKQIASAALPELVNQTIAIGGSSVASSAFNTNTKLVRLHTDAICAIEFGSSPTAVAAGGGTPTMRMAAGQTEYFAPTQGSKVAVVSST